MIQKISLKKAFALFLNDWVPPVITNYHLGLFMFRVYKDQKFKGFPIRIQTTIPNILNFQSLMDSYMEDGILTPHSDFPDQSVFNIIGKNDFPAEDAICTVNPFAYLSHLSAMDFHGFTDRNSEILFLSVPPPIKWKEYAVSLFKKDLGEDFEIYQTKKLPLLPRITTQKVNKHFVQYYSSIHMGAYKTVKDRSLRVSTIGKTFLDMLREPKLCGGIEQVMDVYQKQAGKYLNLIVDELNQHGSPIEKVRAGYILDEICHLQHPALQDWLTFTQRGGSRKLDPTEEFSPIYSAKWLLSINTVQIEIT